MLVDNALLLTAIALLGGAAAAAAVTAVSWFLVIRRLWGPQRPIAERITARRERRRWRVKRTAAAIPVAVLSGLAAFATTLWLSRELDVAYFRTGDVLAVTVDNRFISQDEIDMLFSFETLVHAGEFGEVRRVHSIRYGDARTDREFEIVYQVSDKGHHFPVTALLPPLPQGAAAFLSAARDVSLRAHSICPGAVKGRRDEVPACARYDETQRSLTFTWFALVKERVRRKFSLRYALQDVTALLVPAQERKPRIYSTEDFGTLRYDVKTGQSEASFWVRDSGGRVGNIDVDLVNEMIEFEVEVEHPFGFTERQWELLQFAGWALGLIVGPGLLWQLARLLRSKTTGKTRTAS